MQTMELVLSYSLLGGRAYAHLASGRSVPLGVDASEIVVHLIWLGLAGDGSAPVGNLQMARAAALRGQNQSTIDFWAHAIIH